MPRNICKDKKEFFRTVLESLRDTDSDYKDDYEKFEDIPKKKWKSVLDEYIYDIVYSENVIDGEKNVNVDCENVGEGGEYTKGGLKGLKSLSTGELFYAFDCGGDWEISVNAVIYVEDGKVKFYVPEKGNNFNEKFKCAYGSEPEGSVDANDFNNHYEERLKNRIDKEAELKDIENFFHNDGQASEMLNELEKLTSKLKNIVETREEVFKSEWKGLYFVNTSVWCMRQGRNGNPDTIAANSSNSYPNVFKTYEEAIDYVHTMMMVNHNDQLHNWDKFKEKISIVNSGDAPEHATGYVHRPMENGVERFEGFDVSGHYPCLIDDFIITERPVNAVKNNYDDGSVSSQESTVLEPVQLQHFIKGEKATEFTKQQEEEHQKDVNRIVDEMGGLEGLFDSDQKKELDKMKDLLGWDDEDEK